jgi:hypothetical protein
VETDLIEDKTNINYQTDYTWQADYRLYTVGLQFNTKRNNQNSKWLE